MFKYNPCYVVVTDGFNIEGNFKECDMFPNFEIAKQEAIKRGNSFVIEVTKEM